MTREAQRLKPGRYYKLSKDSVFKCVCGTHLEGPDLWVYVIELKEKPSPRAKTKWSMQYMDMDAEHEVELITKERWSEF